MVKVTIIIAFWAGVLSFLSPCVLPLIPSFLSYLAGTSLKDIEKQSAGVKLHLFLNSVFFVVGFSVVFSILGILLNTLLADISFAVQRWLGRLGGIIIILFGLYVVGLLKLPFLQREYKLHVTKKFSIQYVTSFVFGAAFAVGWTPCVGAVLGTVFALAVIEPTNAFFLLLAYSIGLGMPFLLTGIFTGQATKVIKKAGPWLQYFNIVVGVFLIVIGVMVFTNTLTYISNISFLNRWLLG